MPFNQEIFNQQKEEAKKKLETANGAFLITVQPDGNVFFSRLGAESQAVNLAVDNVLQAYGQAIKRAGLRSMSRAIFPVTRVNQNNATSR